MKKVIFIYLMVKKENSPIMDWRGGFFSGARGLGDH
jgi:hypothetical protein